MAALLPPERSGGGLERQGKPLQSQACTRSESDRRSGFKLSPTPSCVPVDMSPHLSEPHFLDLGRSVTPVSPKDRWEAGEGWSIQ